MENFLRNMTRESVPIDQQINNLLQQQIKRNHEILKSLFKTIIFCGKTTSPSGVHEMMIHKMPVFLETFRCCWNFKLTAATKHCNITWKLHPEMGHISKTIQNEMITTVGAIIVNNLSRKSGIANIFLLCLTKQLTYLIKKIFQW